MTTAGDSIGSVGDARVMHSRSTRDGTVGTAARHPCSLRFCLAGHVEEVVVGSVALMRLR